MKISEMTAKSRLRRSAFMLMMAYSLYESIAGWYTELHYLRVRSIQRSHQKIPHSCCDLLKRYAYLETQRSSTPVAILGAAHPSISESSATYQESQNWRDCYKRS